MTPETEPSTPDAAGDQPDAETPQSDELDQLDAKSRQLVERANREAAERRRELRAAESERDQSRRELEELRQAAESEVERAVREAEHRGHAAAAEVYERRLAEADVVSVAAGRMRDPRDAVAHLDLSELVGVDDADQRRKLVDAQLDRLLEAKPYLALDQSDGNAGPLVHAGGRSEAPSGDPQTPDAWLRKRARGR